MTDVSFHHSLMMVRRSLCALEKDPDAQGLQHDFCRAIRDVKMRLYDAIQLCGGVPEKRALSAVVKKAEEILAKCASPSDYVDSIHRHIKEIRLAKAKRVS
jgi:hypothetical protein